MLMNDYIKGLARLAIKSIPATENDIIDDGGLLRCKICGQPRQTRISVGGEELVVFCLCQCGEKRRAEDEAAEAEAKAASVRAEWLKGYEAMTFAASTGSPTMAFAENYVRHWDDVRANRLSFTLSGNVGCGKTYAAAAIANEILRRGWRVWMAKTSTIVDGWRENKDKFSGRLRSFDLVVLDDFGAERDTEFATEKLFEIVDTRATADLPTIITTNLDLSQEPPGLAYRRIYSRVLGLAPQYRCRGGDMRAEKGAAKKALIKELMSDG